MFRGTVRHRSYVVAGALGASLVLGVLTGRLVGSDVPALNTTPSPMASSTPATVDVGRPSPAPVIVPIVTRPMQPSTPVASAAAPATATPAAIFITRFDGSVIEVPGAQPPE